MATTARASSFLPTIKCSQCSAEIPISMMGDHVCSQVPAPAPSTARLHPLDGPFIPSTQSLSGSRVSKNPPSNINSSVANRPYQPRIVAAHTSTSTASSLRSPSPSSDDGYKRSYNIPTRSLTTPITPSSPEALPQDSAFPIFPTRKAQAPPASASLESHYPPSIRKASNAGSEQADMYAPLSPRENGGGSVLQRMNTIAPGPFNARNKERPNGGLRRTATSASREDFVRSPSIGNSRSPISRPSTAGGVTRNPSISSIAGGSKSMTNRDRPEIPALPSANLTYTKDEDPRRPQSQDEVFSNEKTLQEVRSSTFPLDKPSGKNDRADSAARTSSHRPKPSMSAAATRPLDEIGSFSSFKPSRSLRSRGPSPAFNGDQSPQKPSAPSDTRQDQRLEKAPPVPRPNPATEYGIGNPYHTPNDSISSNGSTGSDARTGSSRSTPPLNESPQRNEQPQRKPGALTSDHNDIHEKATPMESPLLKSPPMSFSRPMYSKPSSISPLKQQPDPAKQQASRGDLAPPPPQIQLPQLQHPRASPLGPPQHSPSDLLPSPSVPLQNGSLLLSPAASHPGTTLPVSSSRSGTPSSPARNSNGPQRRTTDKGKCRGCNLPIKGKSVSSADGRLTGRYHKGCFVCKTCQEPFKTTDFYVHENEPFCAWHYHKINGSLCKGCDGGIEGEYLEDEGNGKWHSGCFGCSDCQTILREDYYELNGRSYCHQHAMRAFQEQSNQTGGGWLGGSRRHPERRTTRLMMM